MKSIECDITFSRAYYSRHFGTAFGERYFQDILYRAETDQGRSRELYGKFSDAGLGDPDPVPAARLGYDDTLNVSLIFAGEQALRLESDYTWIEPCLTLDEAQNLQVPEDMGRVWPHSRFLEEYGRAASALGKENILPPSVHGILETALDLRGSEFLVDLMVEPARADRFLEILTDTVISVKEYWDRKCFGDVQKGVALGSCSTTMLSKKVVADHLVSRYERIASRFGDGFLCSCGVSTQNLENFASIGGVRYVRNGWGTDFEKTARVLKNFHVKAGLDVVRAASLSPVELERDVLHLLTTLEPVDAVSILLINAGDDVPDENIRKIVHTVVRFARDRGIGLSDSGSCKLNRNRHKE